MYATVHNSQSYGIIARFHGSQSHLLAMSYIRNMQRKGINISGMVATWFAPSRYIANKTVTLYQKRGSKIF